MSEEMSRRDKICLGWFIVACAGFGAMLLGGLDSSDSGMIGGGLVLIVGLAFHLLYQETRPITLPRIIGYLGLSVLSVAGALASLYALAFALTFLAATSSQ